MPQFYEHLFHYDAWANRRVIEVLRQAGVTSGRTVDVMSHILIGKRLWLDRIRGEDTSSIAIWPRLSLAECETLFDEAEEIWGQFLAPPHRDWNAWQVRYCNTKGQEFENSVAEILMHVASHAAYHRGQLAILLRQMGHEPVNTDYITYSRSLRGPIDRAQTQR
jgi:uncharacterized damage-inducible protein DinB